MKIIVVGLGVQGYKRRDIAKEDFVASVDPINPEADYRRIEDVPLSHYESALVCLPDSPKVEILSYLFENGKHALVEKPLWSSSIEELEELQRLAKSRNLVCYTAYNHRFEPHFARMRDMIRSGRLGEIYRCRMFYGNGTARLVRESEWRDQGGGVLPDLGSHLLDTAIDWFGALNEDFHVIASNTFENKAPDHVVIGSESTIPKLELEMSLLMWRNHFTCDVFAEKGSAHIESLCKWGPSKFIFRERVLPSGRPPQNVITLEQSDPTWQAEYDYFKKLCKEPAPCDLSRDIWLQEMLGTLSNEAIAKAKA